MAEAGTLLDAIPSLDLADFTSGDPARKAAFVADLGAAFNNIGFVAIKNHGLTPELQDKLYTAVKGFFFTEESYKRQYEIPGIAGQRGYVGKGKETAKGFKVADLKEFYHVGQPHPEQEDGDPVWEQYPRNVFPDDRPDFQTYTLETYRTFEHTGKTLLRAIALYLDLPEDYFEDKVRHGNSILRALHYFPLDPNVVPEGAVRAAAHGDINLITLLMGASAEGLEVLRRDGVWIGITALPDQIIVNVGDMLDRLTNHKLKSTIHRVVNPPRERMNTSRFSIPFFMHPRSEMNLTSLENCIDTEHPKLYTDMTAGEFLDERLLELGLKK
ncbi:isopenicillin N synthase family dioxygenase [Siphonobacter aquaeclarae]|jgi:isopenicillin N synthase-like dioxygenase|uniref:Isopenicillin N synthase n=1 Tax=Siphonobacter aquaeclarae TaxID=563176 RepID=A0A1G9UEP9_9BACT|nr:2-oxoglutarate and iron-dependent oxygenase domain-containing protein [Siphonobacter aquaeclarae]MBO9637563.1 isopenicillin N synthase family oxygenase [Siphonobacter aquaeclarae]SDM58431.1 Isopenicillin N synthase [Siphonobacter aquaeclarae]